MATTVTVTLSPSIDTSTNVDHVIAERKLRCAPPRFDPGGGGVNVARVVHRFGGDALAVYLAGGPTGDLLDRLLEGEGVSRRVVATKAWTRENFIVLENSSTRQYRFGMPGAEVGPDEWQAVLAEIRAFSPAPTYLVASGSLPPGTPTDAYAQMARLARELGSRMVLDTSGEALRDALEEGVYLVKPNIGELAALVGRPFEDEAQLNTAAAGLVERGACEAVVVSLGAGGALLASRDGTVRVHAPTVPIRSKVGAGDSMVAGLVLSLARGLSLREAVRFGVAAGSAAVMNPGTTLSQREDTERLYRRIT